jgi:hypothetical protein
MGIKKLQRTMGFHERIDKDPTILGECLIFFQKKIKTPWLYTLIEYLICYNHGCQI